MLLDADISLPQSDNTMRQLQREGLRGVGINSPFVNDYSQYFSKVEYSGAQKDSDSPKDDIKGLRDLVLDYKKGEFDFYSYHPEFKEREHGRSVEDNELIMGLVNHLLAALDTNTTIVIFHNHDRYGNCLNKISSRDKDAILFVYSKGQTFLTQQRGKKHGKDQKFKVKDLASTFA